MAFIDLNCDLGEGAGADEALMPLITSANIACGAHAGDEATMRASVKLALRHGVAIGAHPGFADRDHFGRREIALAAGEIVALVKSQVGALQRIAAEEGARVVHVKPHGALYNLAARDRSVADAIAEGVRAVDPRLLLVGLAGSESLVAAERAGLRALSEVFADRGYEPDGSLTPRGRPEALIENEAEAVAQVLFMVSEQRVRAVDGTEVRIKAETVCLHGDGVHAVEFARHVRKALAAAGVVVSAPRMG